MELCHPVSQQFSRKVSLEKLVVFINSECVYVAEIKYIPKPVIWASVQRKINRKANTQDITDTICSSVDMRQTNHKWADWYHYVPSHNKAMIISLSVFLREILTDGPTEPLLLIIPIKS